MKQLGMKLAVIKLGSRIVNTGTSGGSGEAMSIIKTLAKNNDVHYYTKILAKDPEIEFATGHQILEEYDAFLSDDYDALIIINGNVNYFGGAEDPVGLTGYKMINNFKGKVFYFYCDPALILSQTWSSVEKKEWKDNWQKEDIEITRDITYVCQPYNMDSYIPKIEKAGIKVDNYIHFPFYKFPLLEDRCKFNIDKKEIDLLYGGTLRGGKREESIIKYFFGLPEDISAEVFGPITLPKFKKYDGVMRPPFFGKAVDYNKFVNKMEAARYSVIIGDKAYYGKTIGQRTYECINANVLTFIDKDYDPDYVTFEDPELRELFYVGSKEELIEKIQKLKTINTTEYKRLLDKQYEDVRIDIDEYSTMLDNIIKEAL